MANGDDLIPPGTPASVRLFLAILRTSGPSVVIALFLIWFITTNVTTSLGAIKTQMDSSHTNMTAFAAEQREFNSRRESQLSVQLRIMRVMCANGAKTDTALKACME